MIHVATTCNDNYVQGLAVTLVSAIVANRAKDIFSFHIFDSGLSESNKQIIASLLFDHSPQSELEFVRIDQRLFGGLLEDYGGGYSTYARLLIGQLDAVDRLIYIDSDFLVMQDLSEAWSMSFEGNILLATRDNDTLDGRPAMLNSDCPFAAHSEVEGYPYFTCGFLVVDLIRWREENVEMECFQRIKGYEKQLKAWDQTLLNYVLRGRIGTLDAIWSLSCGWKEIPEGCNIHFISKQKPWNSFSFLPAYKLWSLFHRMFISEVMPLPLSTEAVLRGTLMHIRDRVAIVSQRFLRFYLNRLIRKHGEKTAEFYSQSLKALSDYHRSPTARSITRETIHSFQARWTAVASSRAATGAGDA